MPYIVTILRVGGQLLAPVPRALLRELGWPKGGRLVVTKRQDGVLEYSSLEDWTRDRTRAARPAPR